MRSGEGEGLAEAGRGGEERDQDGRGVKEGMRWDRTGLEDRGEGCEGGEGRMCWCKKEGKGEACTRCEGEVWSCLGVLHHAPR